MGPAAEALAPVPDGAESVPEPMDAGPGGLRRRLGAGVLDSGCSSGATFLTTLYAAHYFSSAELGAYALFFSGFILSAGLIAAFVYTSAEVSVVARDGRVRLLSLGDSMRAGLLVGGLASVLVMGVSVLVQRQVPLHLRLDFAIPSVLLATISPMQDHVRRMLHSAGLSWLAFRVSLVQFAVVAVVLVGFVAAPSGRVYGPTLGLTAANIISLLVAKQLVRSNSHDLDAADRLPLPMLQLVRRGKLLLLEAALGFGAPYLVVLVLTNVVDIGVVGQVEGVRILAQPISVLGIGLLAPTTPHLFTAGAERDRGAGRRYTRTYAKVMLAGGAVYTLLVAVPWPGSPLPHLFPAAYATSGLLAAQLVTMVAANSTAPWGLQLIGGGWQSRLVVIQAINIVLNLAVSPSALAIGAFASPAGVAVTCLSGVAASLHYQRKMYATPPGTSVRAAREAERSALSGPQRRGG